MVNGSIGSTVSCGPSSPKWSSGWGRKKSDKFLFPISLILRFEGFEGFIVDLHCKRKAYEFTYAHGYEKLSMKHQGH